MNSLMLATVVAAWLPTWPSFDWNAAVIVGAIVAVGAVLVIALAIASPVVAIQGGATMLGTAFTITCIGLITGAIAAGAAGFYWGRQGDLRREQVLLQIAKVSNQLDIHFDADSSHPGEAKPFHCNIVTYEEEGTDSKSPRVVAHTKQIKVLNRDDEVFYAEIEATIQNWLKERKLADEKGKHRHVAVFMKPDPGTNTYSKIRTLAETRDCKVAQINDIWVSALDR